MYIQIPHTKRKKIYYIVNADDLYEFVIRKEKEGVYEINSSNLRKLIINTNYSVIETLIKILINVDDKKLKLIGTLVEKHDNKMIKKGYVFVEIEDEKEMLL